MHVGPLGPVEFLLFGLSKVHSKNAKYNCCVLSSVLKMFVAFVLVIYCASLSHLVKIFQILHCVSKKQDTKLLPITSPNVNRFSKFFHW